LAAASESSLPCQLTSADLTGHQRLEPSSAKALPVSPSMTATFGPQSYQQKRVFEGIRAGARERKIRDHNLRRKLSGLVGFEGGRVIPFPYSTYALLRGFSSAVGALRTAGDGGEHCGQDPGGDT